ncbi:hypothetical protein GDO78_014608 [Eleutherodactylus coqui]|uniref:Uncharacterized protein n=1 Tax=Eleutherodactylus coqui TaxID=57060 RepID=A0A8J6BL65_ELECQ|nr:hypothetical protein GDO78_014608 [Eleutherodactylus coqui]
MKSSEVSKEEILEDGFITNPHSRGVTLSSCFTGVARCNVTYLLGTLCYCPLILTPWTAAQKVIITGKSGETFPFSG